MNDWYTKVSTSKLLVEYEAFVIEVQKFWYILGPVVCVNGANVNKWINDGEVAQEAFYEELYHSILSRPYVAPWTVYGITRDDVLYIIVKR